jgi:hypothetical protein
MLSIPLRSFRQRGGHGLDIDLTYHAKAWAPSFYPSDDSGDIQGQWGLIGSGNYDYRDNIAYGGVALTSNLNYTLNSIPLATYLLPNPDGTNYANTIVYTETYPDGGSHAMLPLTQDGSGSWVPTDGSGSDGISHPDVQNLALQSGATIWQDPNGNQITAATADGQTYLDESNNITASIVTSSSPVTSPAPETTAR